MSEQDTEFGETELSGPGRAVDIVHDAVHAIGQRPYCISYRFVEGVVEVHLLGQPSTEVGEALFARLGAVATLGKPWVGQHSGQQVAQMTGSVPGVDLKVELLVHVSKPHVRGAADSPARVAAVNAAGAAPVRGRMKPPQRPGRTP